jgi:hypothetical protein
MVTKSKKVTKKKTAFDFRTIKTVENAFKKCGYDPAKLPDVSMLPEKYRGTLTTAFILMVIFEAINDGWEPDFSNHDQGKYYPWPWVSSSGFGFSDSYCAYGYAASTVGSRLCTNTSEKALYVLNQFEDLWKDWLLNVKNG